jgi:hypothetical protein
MRLDVLEVLKNFAVREGRLYRKRADLTLKPLQTVEHGRLVVVFQGRKVYGTDLAWACHYSCAPMFPVVTIDLDPLNVSIENLGSARVRRYKLFLRCSGGRWSHNLGGSGFREEWEARRDWIARARSLYQEDLPYVLTLQASTVIARPVDEKPVELMRVSTHTRRQKPAPVQGLSWYWFKGQWVAIPPAVHPSDDWQVRAAALLEDPHARRVYDDTAEKTLTATLQPLRL